MVIASTGRMLGTFVINANTGIGGTGFVYFFVAFRLCGVILFFLYILGGVGMGEGESVLLTCLGCGL